MRLETRVHFQDVPVMILTLAFLLLLPACSRQSEGAGAGQPAPAVAGQAQPAEGGAADRGAGGAATAEAGKNTGTCIGGAECGPEASAAGAPEAKPKAPEGRVKRIVFLDQEECCECTRNRQNTSWNNLQQAIDGVAAKPPVEVIHVDSQADLAAPYKDLEALMVTPGIYFFDHQENLLEMVQGEVSREQVDKILH